MNLYQMKPEYSNYGLSIFIYFLFHGVYCNLLHDSANISCNRPPKAFGFSKLLVKPL